MSNPTMDRRYKDEWFNVHRDCMLCDMEKKTKWYLETPRLVIAEKLGGGPFVVWKAHTKELTEEQREVVEHAVGILFDDFDIAVRMNLVEDHWHGHIVTDDEVDLSNE